MCFASLLSHVWLFETPWTVCQAPLSMGILQARILEWVAMPSTRGSSQPWDWTQVSCIAGRFFTIWVIREAPLSHIITHVLMRSLVTMDSPFLLLCRKHFLLLGRFFFTLYILLNINLHFSIINMFTTKIKGLKIFY